MNVSNFTLLNPENVIPSDTHPLLIFDMTANWLHPSIVHFPIALLLTGSLLALLCLYWDRLRSFSDCVLWLLLLGWIGFAPAILTGLLSQGGLPPDAPYRGLLNRHISAAVGAALLYAALLYLWWLRRPRSNRPDQTPLLQDTTARWWVTALLIAGIGLVAICGYYGGKLVYDWGVNVG